MTTEGGQSELQTAEDQEQVQDSTSDPNAAPRDDVQERPPSGRQSPAPPESGEAANESRNGEEVNPSTTSDPGPSNSGGAPPQSKNLSSNSPVAEAGPSGRNARSGSESPRGNEEDLELGGSSPGPGDSDGDSDGADSKDGSSNGNETDSQGSEAGEQRVIFINNSELTNELSPKLDNRIRTSKYTLLTFLPKNLFEQFHRYAYIYFLIIIIMNQIPMLAVFGRTLSVIPLLFVLSVTALKDIYEDVGRQKSDTQENNRTALVLKGDGEYQPKRLKDIRVGEILKIHKNEAIPCDLVLLSTSDPSGVAYVETANLDGESNLKIRHATHFTASGEPQEISLGGKAKLVCEPPNRNIYEFSGYIKQNGEHQSVGPNNIVLRSCALKNTAWVVGVVVYAGQDTKVMLNSSGPRSKRSLLERDMNISTLWLALFLFIMCAIMGVGMALWVNRHSDDLNRIPYYRKRKEDGGKWRYYGVLGEGIVDFLSCVIVFQTMIPISLYVSMELVRLGQVYFMNEDLGMYDESSDSPFQSRALNICEDLGQIKYVFSDKTGTLTENKMVFAAASIDGVDYSDAKEYEATGSAAPGSKESSTSDKTEERAGDGSKESAGWQPKEGAVVDPNLVECLQQPLSEGGKLRSAVHEYMLVLAACNTVMTTKVPVSDTDEVEDQVSATSESPKTNGNEEEKEQKKDEEEKQEEQEAGQKEESEEEQESEEEASGTESERPEYQGESPDEEALVAAAADYGYTLLERTSKQLTLNILGETQELQLMGINEFDSMRRRMSVVIRFPDGTTKLLVKGADSSMLELVRTSEEDQQPTLEHLHQYARKGLRTLVVATKDLQPQEVQEWEALYKKADTELASDREEALKEAALLVEKDLNLIGATGIEDQLQKEVPGTIAQLREANIKVWVLTGDKQETAISIAFSCLLITEEMQQIIINEKTLEGCREALDKAISTHVKSRSSPNTSQGKTIFSRLWRKTNAANVRPGSSSGSSPSGNGGNSNHNSPENPDHSFSDDNGGTEQSEGEPSVINGGTPDHEDPNGKTQSLQESESKSTSKRNFDPNAPLALIIDGNSLEHCLSEELEQGLFDLAIACKVIVCCRVAPYQKAAVVSLVKQKAPKNDLTLAIGDGANDVSMLQMADIGVGIGGKEGRQAVMASDFAIGQFRFLHRMLLVHGHWNYFRLSYMVLYNIYRNAALCFLLFWYILYTEFSPTQALNQWNLVLYSLIYTAVPTIVVGILDQDVNQKSLVKHPGLYNYGQSRLGYNQRLFIIMMLETVWQSLVMFYVPFLSYRHTPVGIWGLGGLWTLAIVMVVSLQLAMDIQLWTWIHHVAIWASILSAWIGVVILDSFKDVVGLRVHYRVIHHMFTEWAFWFNLPLIVIAALLPRFLIRAFRERLFPSDVQVIRNVNMLAKQNGADHGALPGGAHGDGVVDGDGPSLSHLERGESSRRRELEMNELLSPVAS